MIVKELFMTRADGVNLYRTYSDEGKSLLQVETGRIYDEAVDIEGAPYTYEEYAEPTDDPEDTAPEIEEDIDESEILTRAELTAKVTELEEQNAMLMECLLEMSEAVYA